MKIKILVFSLMLLATIESSYAKDLSVVLSDQDQQTILAALDAYVKSGGLNTAISAVILFQKLQAAAQAPDQAQTVNPPNAPPVNK